MNLTPQDEKRLKTLWLRLLASVGKAKAPGRVQIEAVVILDGGRVSLDSRILAPQSLHESLDGGSPEA